MSEPNESRTGEPGLPGDEQAERPGRAYRRRAVLGGAAAVAAGGALAGCSDGGSGAGADGRPGTAGTPAATGRALGASGAPTGAGTPGQGTTAAENALAGDAGWRLTRVGAPEAVQGYADKVSVLPGESFRLHVSTTAPGFRVTAFRIGWYGGAQARRVWQSERVPGRAQAAPKVEGPTRTVRAHWEPSLTVPTDGWPAGAYLLRLDAEGGSGQRYVPMVVRSASAEGRTLVMHGAATWQAYNTWGGYSLYQGADGSYPTRSLAVSFDRPYDGGGAEKFLVYERAAVVLAERLGLPLAYTTGLDVHADPSVLRGATTLVSLGHDEYWTPQQRASVTRGRDHGSNLVFLGANTCYRRVRIEDGGRTVVCYKTDYRDDPDYWTHRPLTTTDFRSGPAPDPESSMTGVLYEGFPVDAPYVVHAADHWTLAGTGVARGDTFPHLVGVEYDRVTPSAPTPRPIEVIAHSPVVCEGAHSFSDTAYYTVRGGAGVFATGTMRWVEGLMAGTRDDGGDHGIPARTARFVATVTGNVLTAFAAGPAAAHRPEPRDNLAELYGS